jgi:hypothetical protein
MQLLHGDWVDEGALISNDALTPDEIGDPALLHNALVFLTSLRDEGPAKATTGGNLSRAFVGLILDRLRFAPGFLEDVRRMNTVIDEPDVPDLHNLRYVLQFARLIHQRKGFHITPLGRKLLSDERRGPLFALLFRTFFRELDLRVIYGQQVGDGLQRSLGFTFFKLRSEAEAWTTPAHLANVAWLETSRDVPPPGSVFAEGWFPIGCMRYQVLEPLVDFGVLESRNLPSRDKWDRPIEVRKTPLFDRLLRFEFQPYPL